MRLLRTVLSFTLVVTFAACADATGNPDLATEFRETPLRMLPGVQIGMQAQQLKRARPAARYAPYLGLQESIPGYGVSYRFESAVGDVAGSDVSSRDDLKAVFIAKVFDQDDSTAAAAWREQVAALASSRRAPDACDSIPGGGRQARWFSGKQGLVAGVFPASSSFSARLIVVVGRMEYIKEPRGATPVPCPNP